MNGTNDLLYTKKRAYSGLVQRSNETREVDLFKKTAF